MTTFLFRNLNRKPLEAIVTNLVLQYEVDVIMLTECSIAPDVLLRTLNPLGTPEYHYAPGIGCRKVEIFTRFLSEFIRPKFEMDRLTIRHLKLPGLTDILLAITHFPSKLHWKEQSQAHECINLANSIRSAEEEVGILGQSLLEI